MSEVGWDEVTYLRKRPLKTTGQRRTQQAVNAAQKQGVEIETQKKLAATTNRQQTASKNTAKLDRETEELHHDKVGIAVSRLIQQTRQAKGFSQKELATKINEKPQIINDYESARAIPNNQILGKLERALGVKLRGKDKGNPLQVVTKKK